MIASYVADNHKHWDQHLANFRFAINSAVQETTGVTPAELNLGRTLRGPLDVLLRPWTPLPGSSSYKKVTELQNLKAFVQANLTKGRTRQKRNYNKTHRDVQLPDFQLHHQKTKIRTCKQNRKTGEREAAYSRLFLRGGRV